MRKCKKDKGDGATFVLEVGPGVDLFWCRIWRHVAFCVDMCVRGTGYTCVVK